MTKTLKHILSLLEFFFGSISDIFKTSMALGVFTSTCGPAVPPLRRILRLWRQSVRSKRRGITI